MALISSTVNKARSTKATNRQQLVRPAGVSSLRGGGPIGKQLGGTTRTSLKKKGKVYQLGGVSSNFGLVGNWRAREPYGMRQGIEPPQAFHRLGNEQFQHSVHSQTPTPMTIRTSRGKFIIK